MQKQSQELLQLIQNKEYQKITILIEKEVVNAITSTLPNKFLIVLIKNFNLLPQELQESALQLVRVYVNKNPMLLHHILKIDPTSLNTISKIFLLNIDLLSKDCFFDLLESSKYAYNFIDFFKVLIENNKSNETLFSVLVKYSLDFYRADLLVWMKEKNNNLFERIILSLPEDQAKLIDKLVNIQSPNATSKYMSEFTRGFGNITFQGGLLTCSQLADRKGYSNMVVLSDHSEFEELIMFVQKRIEAGSVFPRDSIKFIMTGNHWGGVEWMLSLTVQ